MFRVLWNGKSAMNANQEKLDAISNNLANATTDGYKRIDVSFKDLMTETLDRKGYPTDGNKAYTGTGVRAVDWVRYDEQGPLNETKNDSNFALDGKGYFMVRTQDGTYAYERQGNFEIDRDGKIVDSSGNVLQMKYENGYNEKNVRLYSGTFTVDTAGNVFSKADGNYTKVAEIPVYNAMGSKAFVSKGDNLYVPNTGTNVYREKNVDIVQGYVEGSNVDMGQEFTDMIMTQRAFQLGSKAISTADEMWGMINQIR
ncbi:flagellar hook-basal body complex protein [Inconstantimicrobium mannanitabidum]|uniref:Flagellar basal body protein n=1 Tax=Inconstantimicrobium mannanitabidum TaxID=1604901 RepID=A0ACB5R8Z9_9CLOT|nr:flagellar hook-basal body complex protein [Clostridium sp. TW13]GKX65511.1 flagellar basal body protein [Clostridium sp. TW13]